MKSIVIIGAGSSGLAMAAHLSLNGYRVRIWNRSLNTIKELRDNKFINCKGIIDGKARLEIVTTDIAEALEGSDLIMITTPADSHKEIAYRIAPYLSSETLIVLNPGRTFGAIEFARSLHQANCDVVPTIAETQTTIYTCRKVGFTSVVILTIKKDVLISTFNPRKNDVIIGALPKCLQEFFASAETMIQTSIGNVGMILHCAPILLNIGWIESPKTKFKYYYEGITPSVARLLEVLDRERVEVSKMLGKPVESAADWLIRSYGIKGDSLYDCIQNNEAYRTIDAPSSLQHRYIYEDVPCGLVPLEAVGKFFGLSMKMASLIIDLASEIVKVDFREQGRNLKRLGFEGRTVDEIRKEFGVA